MAFEQVTANNQVGFQSPHYQALANNTFGIDHLTNASSDDDVGVLKAPMPQGKARLVVRTSDSFGAGESLAVSILYRGAAGALVAVAVATLVPANVAAAGEHVIADNLSVSKIDPGAVIQLRRVYTAGGTPDDPEVAFTLQLY